MTQPDHLMAKPKAQPGCLQRSVRRRCVRCGRVLRREIQLGDTCHNTAACMRRAEKLDTEPEDGSGDVGCDVNLGDEQADDHEW